MDTTNRLTRQELYEAVWTTSVLQLAKQYGLSDVGLAKVCVRHRIPRPGLGYWAKRQHGKADPRPPLPTIDDPALDVVVLRERSDKLSGEGPERHAIDDEVNERMVAELHAPAITVASVLRNPHPHVAAAIEEDDYRASRKEHAGSGAEDTGFVAYKEVARASVYVSAGLRARAYRIMDALLKAAIDRGYRVLGKPDKHQRVTNIEMLGETFDVHLYEPSLQRPHVLTAQEAASKAKYGSVYAPKFDYERSNQLCLQLKSEGGSMVLWQARDGQKVRIEDRLNKFFIAAMREVDQHRKWATERAREEATRREAAERRQREEERHRQEEADLKSLLEEVGRWRRSREIREYLSEVRRVVAGRGQAIQPGSEMDQWLQWAEETARAMDPLR